MALLNRGDTDLYYEVHGKGPAILLTHGYSANTRMWGPGILSSSGMYVAMVAQALRMIRRRIRVTRPCTTWPHCLIICRSSRR